MTTTSTGAAAAVAGAGDETTDGRLVAPASELLPCPFCGEAEHLYPTYAWPGGGKSYAIDCLGCGIDFTPRKGMDVVAAWNRRTA